MSASFTEDEDANCNTGCAIRPDSFKEVSPTTGTAVGYGSKEVVHGKAEDVSLQPPRKVSMTIGQKSDYGSKDAVHGTIGGVSLTIGTAARPSLKGSCPWNK